MIRFVVLLLGLWAVVALHAPYQQSAVPKALTGQEAVSSSGGLVVVTGVVNTIQPRPDGSHLLRLDCQGAMVTVFADALHRPQLPQPGRSVQVTGRRTGQGFLILEDPKALREMGVLAQADSGRIHIPISKLILQGRTASGRYDRISFIVEDGVRTDNAMVAHQQTAALLRDQPTELTGYELPGRRFVIESWH